MGQGPAGLRHAPIDSALVLTAVDKGAPTSLSPLPPSRHGSSLAASLPRGKLHASSDVGLQKASPQVGVVPDEPPGAGDQALAPPSCALRSQGLAGSSGTVLRPALCAFPMADPDYDETRVPEAAELAAKYGGAWLRAALPRRVPASHPLLLASVRHVDGSLSLVHARNMRPLQAGCPLYVGGEAHLTALHPQLPPGLHYIPANMYDWGTAEPRYMTVHFTAPGHLYVLLPENTAEPRWLRKQFFKLREPLYGIKVNLQCSWNEGGIGELFVRVMTATRKTDRSGQLLVYKSKQLYLAGDVEYLGGVPTAHFGENLYILCACFASEEEVQHEARMTVPGSVAHNVTDWALWYPRMLKSIRRNRLEDVRALLSSDAWTQRPFRNDPISWLPPDEVEAERGGSPLTSDLAVGFGSVEMLSLLVAQCHCQLSVRGLRLLVHKWEEVPEEHGGALELLLGYLRRCPRPLGTLACVLSTLRREIERRDRARSSSTMELRAVLRRFQELQTQLLHALSDMVRHRGHNSDHDSQSLSWLQGVVDPPQQPRPLVLADHSPLRIAFDDRDFGFMASVVMEGYTRQKWMGSALLALSSRDGTGGVTILDPSILLTVMRRMGLCDDGILSAALFRVARLWFLVCVVPAHFIASPRGRWWMRLLACVSFIVVFNVVLTQDYTVDMRSVLLTVSFFSTFLLGTLVEAVETVAVAYQGSLSRFARRNPQEVVFLGVEALVLALVIMYMLQVTGKANLDESVYVRLVLVWASIAVVFYVKFLYTLVPLVQRLGPLLNTVVNMMSELSAFLLPFLVITAGFATSYHIIFNGVGAKLDSFADAMLMLFEAFMTSFDFSRWDELPVPEYRLFGIILLVIYLVLAGILLANLLIAIISYKYRPDEVAAQSIFGLAEVVDRHQLQVDNAMLCSPFCLLQVPFNLLPRGTRPAILPYSFFRLGLAPLEGFRPAAPHLNTVPTGRDAVPQLLFHLTLHPIMLALTNAAFYAVSPLCVIYFALHGHQAVWDQLWPPKSSGRARQGAGSGGSATQTSRSMSMQTTLGAARSGRRSQLSGSFESETGSGVGVLGARSGDPWQHVGGFCTLRGMVRLAQFVGRTAAALVVGALVCYGPVGLFLVTGGGLYMWAACTLLSVYNVLYEPAVRVMAAVAWRRWRKRLRRRSAVMDGASVHGTEGSTTRPAVGSPSGEQENDESLARASAASEAGASIGDESESGAAGGGTRLAGVRRSVTAAQVARKWILLAKGVARKGTAERYLTRQQVDAAIARTFGYRVSAALSGTAGPAGAARSAKPEGGSESPDVDSAGPSKRVPSKGPGAQLHEPPQKVSYMWTPHFDLRQTEAQQEARDIAVLGRAMPGEHGVPPHGPGQGRPGTTHGRARLTRFASSRVATAGDATKGEPAAVERPRRPGPHPTEPHQSVGEEHPPGSVDGEVSREELCAKLQEQELEVAELRAQVEVLTGLLGDQLGSAQGREEARQRRRSVLLQAYGDENY